ncbi:MULTISPECIES: fluoride efflux transporter FluC [unclassified Knoellia]|uniref:fluoride efflux transporter FluC n=1 Tax=Knoellia altitudinis TaxID=3404795 RepID=UPI003610E9C0
MTAWLLVAVGAAVGAPLRYAVTQALRERGATSHAGTLLVNVVGSLVLGLLVAGAVDGRWLALLGTGFCGALTTMSTLALEVWDSVIEGRARHAAATLVLHLVLGLGAAWLGWALAA